jgi:hypothetical protein
MKKALKYLLIVIFIPIVLLLSVIAVIYYKQETIVKELVTTMNKDFVGEVEIKGSHISPFENFPYISIDLEGVKIWENKEVHNHPIFKIQDLYLGFDFWTLINGTFDIKFLKLSTGEIHLVQHLDGDYNITKAFQTTHEVEDMESEFHLDLQKIEVNNVKISKLSEETDLKLIADIQKAFSKFKAKDDHTSVGFDSEFLLTVIKGTDTTFVKNKHFDIFTQLNYDSKKQHLEVKPSEILMGGAIFKMEGGIDIADDLNMDIKFSGEKPNFDLFIAFAPDELIPTLKKYENKGKVFFDATVKGKSANGNNPRIDANFGCSEAYFANSINKKKLDELQFMGYFTNGDKQTAETMEFQLKNFSAKPEAGTFSGNLMVKNFISLILI